MANTPGRFRQGGLGNLPDYSDAGPRAPVGVPPPAGYIPAGGTGQPDQPIAVNQSFWQSQPFNVGLTALQIQPFLRRKFLLIQNKDAANTIYLGFGWIPTPGNGLVLAPGQSYEPYTYPVNEIWALSSGASTAGLIITGV